MFLWFNLKQAVLQKEKKSDRINIIRRSMDPNLQARSRWCKALKEDFEGSRISV